MKLKRLAILVFCAGYLGVQIFLIVGAHFRSDKRFGFWMFAESTRYTASLFRQTFDGRLLSTEAGVWTVRTLDGGYKTYAWGMFVQGFRLKRLEVNKRAKVGMAVTLKYLEHALDYVAGRIPYDRETERLVLVIDYRRAGGESIRTRLQSQPRHKSEEKLDE